MTVTHADMPADLPPTAPEPPPFRTLAVRRSGRLGTRLLAVLSLLLALGVTGYVVRSELAPAVTPPLQAATAGAWTATGTLSDRLRALRPGAPRSAAQALVAPAARAVKAARTRVEALDLPTADTPARARVLQALRADGAWISAVRATLANPRSARRAKLSALARTAAEATALAAKDVRGAAGTVGGTGRLLSATHRG